MKIRRTFLKCKSRYYYYTLVIIGSVSMLFLTCCHNPNQADKTAYINDSVAKTKHQYDSITKIAKADSIAHMQKEKAKADSIAKAKKIHNNIYKPAHPVTKYGIPIHHNATKYGVLPNTY